MRAVAAALALALVAAACRGGGGGGGTQQVGSGVEIPTTTTRKVLAPPPAVDGSRREVVVPHGSTAPGRRSDARTGASGSREGGRNGGPPPSRSAGRQRGGITVHDRDQPGVMGPALLRPEVPEVAIEIDTTPGQSLTDQARERLRQRIEEHGNKRSVVFAPGSALPARAVYSTDELLRLMEEHRAVWSSPTRVGVYVMVLSGRHEERQAVAVAFAATAFAIFPDRLDGGLLGLNYPNYEEAAVIHELGHLFGLVNLTGHGAFHEDSAHPGHSANEESVMFWAVESTLVRDLFEGGPPRNFDADDLRELAAIRAS